MKKNRKILFPVVLAIGLVACYPNDAQYIDEFDTALTHYDETTDFTQFHTFVMPDSMVYIRTNGDTVRIDREFDKKILSLVRKNFENYNYRQLTPEEITAGAQPDIAVTVSAFSNAYFYFSYGYSWYDYWGWYPGWNWFWGSSWYSYYPWYPWYGGTTVYAYDQGTVLIDILHPAGIQEGSSRIPVLWTGVVDGILAGSRNYINSRLEKNINQCFIQSPYLKTTK